MQFPVELVLASRFCINLHRMCFLAYSHGSIYYVGGYGLISLCNVWALNGNTARSDMYGVL